MKPISRPYVVILSCALFFATASAQAVVFVAVTGNDGNDCLTPATACRQIGAALTKQTTVHVAPGDYEPFTIDSGEVVSIVGEPGATIRQTETVPTPSLQAAITIESSPGVRQVRIEGLRVVSRLVGLLFTGTTSTVFVDDCVFVSGNFVGPGYYAIDFTPSGFAPVAGGLYISNSVITRDNDFQSGGSSSRGIRIRPGSIGAPPMPVTLDNVQVIGLVHGVTVDGFGDGEISMTIRNSTISGNSQSGIGVFEPLHSAPTNLVIEGSTISANGSQGIVASRSSATIRVRDSVITGNTLGVQGLNGGKVISYGGNVLAANDTDGAFTSALPPQ